MRKAIITLAGAALLMAGATAVMADHHKELPPGPIHDRHELMEGIGKNAKTIGGALKSGKHDPIAKAAEDIQAGAAKIPALFPKGSTHENSRALPAIWENWDKFESLSKEMGTKAGELAAAAKSGGNVGAAADAMFGNCKSCHDDFRKPDEKE